MGIVVVPEFGADPVTITGPTLDAKVDGLATEFNGQIDDDNIASGAGIGNAKLNLASISQNITHSGTMTHSGVLTMTAKDITEAKGADIASATTTTIWATDGNFMHITGTTTITGFGTAQQAGDCRTIVFDGILTLTHNATSLILPTGANITTAAGDTAVVRAETTANARVIAYLRKDGTALAGGYTPSVTNALSGSIIQTVKTSNSTGTAISATYTADDNPPNYDEGNVIISRTITPSNASNLLRVTFSSWFGKSTTGFFYAFLTTGTGSTVAIKTASQTCTNGDQTQIYLQHFLTAGGTSEITFYIVGAVNTGTATMLSTSAGGHLHGASSENLLIVEEIKA